MRCPGDADWHSSFVLRHSFVIRISSFVIFEEPSVAEQNIGNYRLVKLLGNGQTSQVWEVVEQTSSRHFAMKVLSSGYASKAEARNAIFHEAEVGLQMAHANVIKIFSVNKDKASPHYIMEHF